MGNLLSCCNDEVKPLNNARIRIFKRPMTTRIHLSGGTGGSQPKSFVEVYDNSSDWAYSEVDAYSYDPAVD